MTPAAARRMSYTTRACLWASLGLVMLVSTVTTTMDNDNCQTLMTEISISKQKNYEYNGRRVRLYCAGIIPIRKCEGACTSQVSPSVVNFPGFLKDCKCCRESDLVDRLVTLTKCYEGNQEISGQSVSLYVKEPTDCQCFSCNNL